VSIGTQPYTPLSTRHHPEEAQAFATRGPANEGSLYSPGSSEGAIGCATSRPFRDAGVGKREDAEDQSVNVWTWSVRVGRTLLSAACEVGVDFRRVAHPNVVFFDVRMGTLTLVCFTAERACPASRTRCEDRGSSTATTLPRLAFCVTEFRLGSPHVALVEMWVRQASSENPSTRRHPEEAQAFATRRPADEGSLYSPGPDQNPSRCHPEQSEGSGSWGLQSRVPHSSRFSRCGYRDARSWRSIRRRVGHDPLV
jgi:hypothetical protein